MMERVLSFLRDHKEIALATSEGNMPKLRIFQIMKQEEHVLYFATSSKKAVYRDDGYTTIIPCFLVSIRAMTRWNTSACQ